MSLDSDTLRNNRHERFAQLVALGVQQGQAWSDTAPAGTFPAITSSRVHGSRVANRPDVSKRIKFLQTGRNAARTAPTRLATPSDLKVVLMALTEALSGIYERLRIEGATEDELASVRALTSGHSQRALSVADLAKATPVPNDAISLSIKERPAYDCPC